MRKGAPKNLILALPALCLCRPRRVTTRAYTPRRELVSSEQITGPVSALDPTAFHVPRFMTVHCSLHCFSSQHTPRRPRSAQTSSRRGV